MFELVGGVQIDITSIKCSIQNVRICLGAPHGSVLNNFVFGMQFINGWIEFFYLIIFNSSTG